MSTNITSYKELLAQREALEQQIAAARKAEVADAVQKIRGLVK
ncbi:MAG: H-NS histone family protein, partial [Comamonas sp.]